MYSIAENSAERNSRAVLDSGNADEKNESQMYHK